MQSYIVSKKVVVPDFKKVDKRKKLVGQHDFDSNFEDENSAPKMKKSKNKIRENARVTRSKVSVSVGKVDDKKSNKKKSRNVCKNVDVGLQTPSARKKQNEVLVDLVIENYSFGDDVSVPLDVMNNSINDQSPLDDIPFFIESQLVALEPTFRVLETPKEHIATPIMFDKSPVGVYNQSDTSSRRCPLYFKSKHPFQEYIRSAANTGLQNKIISEFVLTDIKIGDKDWFFTMIHTGRSWNDEHREVAYIDKSLSESLEYVILKDTPQQGPQSKYGALLWDYARRKQNDGAISESEATENVTSKHGGFKRSREQFESSRTR
ncbi:hypothetical protein BC332_11330 [Capsicum chinense]|nr:hypothetical protein BC332_11330 [Capsicum chinense]